MRRPCLVLLCGLVLSVILIVAAAPVCLPVVCGPSNRPAPDVAWAQGQGIEVVSQGAESQFPDAAKFSLTVKSPDEISGIRVLLRRTGNTTTSSYRPVDFTPGKEVTGESILRTGTGSSYIPPGTLLEYSFEIRDKGGRVYRSPNQSFIYLDNRLQWQTVSDGLVTVYYYSASADKRAQTILDAAKAALDRMGPVLGIKPTEPLRIVSYNDYRHMSEALPFRAQVVRDKLITQGMAFSDQRVLLVLGFDRSVRGTTSHEFTHLLVHEATGRAHPQVPAWLDEGLAEYGNIEPTEEYDTALRFAILNRRLKPLWYLGSFGGDQDDIIIAYGQARSVIHYIIDKYGQAKMAQLMRALQDTMNIDKALQQVYAFDQYGLDSEWRTTIGLEPVPPPNILERQLRSGQEATATPEPAPTATPAATPTSTPTPTTGNRGPGASPGGCRSGSANHVSPIAADLASLILLGGPLAMVSVRVFWRKRQP